jgi:MoaA/NifB/PqqE/SkfB family radical SAM enzyme
MQTLTVEPATADRKPQAAIPVPPASVAPGKKSFLKLMGEVLDHGGPGFLQFAITNICNAQCEFCGFARNKLDPRRRHSVSLEEVRNVIAICVKNHIGYLLFVGGEPLVHKDLPEMIRSAALQGIRPMVCTNGSLWTEDNMRHFARQGLSSVIMSVDTHDARRHEAHRSLSGVCRKIRRANQVFASLGIQTTASVTASRLIEDYQKLPDFLRALGFSSCTFSYPLTRLDSGYLSFSDSHLVTYQTAELIEVFEKIRALKRRGGFRVVNPDASLDQMQRHLRGEPEKFGCLAGHKYFYLDWNLQLYRCHAWDKPICHIYEFDQSRFIRDGCTRCMIDCYRDPSVLQYAAISAMDAWRNLKAGRPVAAAKNIFDTRNLTSLRAVWQDRRWVGKV